MKQPRSSPRPASRGRVSRRDRPGPRPGGSGRGVRRANPVPASEPADSWARRGDELVSRAAVRLLESRDPGPVIEELCREALGLLGAEAFVTLVADPETGHLRVDAQAGFRVAEVRALASPAPAAGGRGRPARRTRPPSSPVWLAAWLRSRGFRTGWTRPLLAEGSRLGLLSFARRPATRFTPAQRRFLDRVARLVAAALHGLRIQQQAEVSRARLGAALESMTDAVFISDVEGRFVEFNEAFATFHRFPGKPECARTLAEYPRFLEVCFADGRPAPLDQWAVPRALRGETVVNAEYRLRRRDTGEAWVGSYNFGPIRDRQGGIVGSVVVGRDITETKRAAEALRVSEERLSLAQRAGHVGVFDWDILSRRAVWTPELEEMFGLPPGAFEGVYEGWAKRVLPDDLERVERAFGEWIRSGRARLAWEYRIRRADGEVRWIAARAEIFRGPDGRPVRMIGTNHDVTERKRAEEATRESEARLRTVMDTVLVGFVVIDENGRIEDVNRGTCTMFGYEPGELVGRNVSVLMPSPDRERHPGYLAHYRRTGQKRIIGSGREVMALTKDGNTFPVELTVAELEVGGRRLFVGTLSDVSHRRRLETEVVVAFERAQQELGADLHDGLGQHLHGVKYLATDLAERLRRRRAPERREMRRFVGMIDQAIEQARGIARGLTPVEAVPEGLEWGLRRLARELTVLHRATVRFQCPSPVRVGSPMVARHLYRIAQEAAANSLRHSRGTRLVISLAATPENLVMAIRDNGVGIGPRGDGIGLHVMQYRANAMRASLVVQSTPGRGTEVACTVPWWAANAEPTPDPAPRPKTHA